MNTDKRFLDISFNYVLREIIASLKIDTEDIAVFFEKKKAAINPDIINKWIEYELPTRNQFDNLIQYIDERVKEFDDIDSLHATVKKLKEYINYATLIRARDKTRLIKGVNEIDVFFVEVLTKAYNYQKYVNTTDQQIDEFLRFFNKERPYQPEVFISYSWDSEQHREAVSFLADLFKEANINVKVDRDLQYAQNIDSFMSKIMNCDYVLVICTPQYKKKADDFSDAGRETGVGKETNIISQELQKAENENKFIPILLFGGDKWEESLPFWAKEIKGIDLRPLVTAVTEKGVDFCRLVVKAAVKGVDLHTLANKAKKEGIDLDKLIKTASELGKLIEQLCALTLIVEL